jgi:lambda family phage minor tail protein L
MKSIPTVVVQEKNKLFTPDPWIVLLEIALDASTTLYFCSNNENVTFGGRLYTAFPFRIEQTKQTSRGEIPTVELRVCNVTRLIHSYLEALDGAVGAQVTVKVVNAGHLTADYTELDMTFSVLATQADAEWITFTLGSISPLRARFPQCRFTALHCNWDFKGFECAYAGAATDCDRTWTRCQALGNAPRFGGYPGLNQIGWRMI